MLSTRLDWLRGGAGPGLDGGAHRVSPAAFAVRARALAVGLPACARRCGALPPPSPTLLRGKRNNALGMLHLQIDGEEEADTTPNDANKQTNYGATTPSQVLGRPRRQVGQELQRPLDARRPAPRRRPQRLGAPPRERGAAAAED